MSKRFLAIIMALGITAAGSGCNVIGNFVDVTVYPGEDEEVSYALIFRKFVGSAPATEADTSSPKAQKIILEDIDIHCGPSGTDATGSWGVHDTDRTSGFTATGYERRSTTYPDSTMVACAQEHFADSVICDLGGVSAQDEYGVGSDCQDEEDNYLINEPATQLYHDLFTDVVSADETADFLANIYDTYYGTYVWTTSVFDPYKVATCVIGKTTQDQAYPFNGVSTSVSSAIC